MGALFPAVHNQNHSRVQAGRFAHFDYFDRYLAQAIPEGDIPDALISRALERAVAGHEHDLRALLAEGDDDRVMLALSKIRARYPDVGETEYYVGPTGPVAPELLALAMTLFGEAHDDRIASWTSTSDQLRYWAATLLRRLLEDESNPDVDSALLKCTQIHRRAHLLMTARRDLSLLKEETQTALNDALQREVDRILPMLLADLREGDNSDGEPGSAFLYELVADSPKLNELQTQIADGLAANDFTIGDVAARFVGLAYVIGGSGRPTRASFSGELFTKVTGAPARSTDRAETSEWPDTSWPRRREFAMPFIGPTVGEDGATPHEEPDDQQ